MPLTKPIESLKIAILIPSYKRHEYLVHCLRRMDKAQKYYNTTFYIVSDGDGITISDIELIGFNQQYKLIQHPYNLGLRHTILEFFDNALKDDVDFIVKMDNDCLVPDNWMNDILKVFDDTDVDILSPNVRPSNAARFYGKVVHGLPYLPADIIGGLWFMRSSMIKGIAFNDYQVQGLVGAIPILRQIIAENKPKVGWLENVVVDDMGHWSGSHPQCIKSKEHEEYYSEVGRKISWKT